MAPACRDLDPVILRKACSGIPGNGLKSKKNVCHASSDREKGNKDLRRICRCIEAPRLNQRRRIWRQTASVQLSDDLVADSIQLGTNLFSASTGMSRRPINPPGHSKGMAEKCIWRGRPVIENPEARSTLWGMLSYSSRRIDGKRTNRSDSTAARFQCGRLCESEGQPPGTLGRMSRIGRSN